jgi:ADP-ribosylglycohydrolase
MIGAIAGDIIGSVYERNNIKTTDFPLFTEKSRFTDDTVLTVAVADAILDNLNYAETLKVYGQRYPNAGYSGAFRKWIFSPNSEPYNSWGNGSAMRVSSIGWAFNTLEDVLKEAEKSAAVTHNHPEGIKGAQSVALSIFLARNGASKEEIKKEIGTRFSYNLNRTLPEIRPEYKFDVSCQGSVPESIIAFLESDDFEDAIRLAISIGGDSDTIACIAGSIAHAFYKEVPAYIISEVKRRMPEELWQTVEKFDLLFNSTMTQSSVERFQGNSENLGELFESYLKTDYVIEDGAVNLRLRIGERNSDLDELLLKFGESTSIFLTAYNPCSKEINRAENETRQTKLISILKDNGYKFFYGYGQGDSADWTPEPSVLVLGIDFNKAFELARRFEQNAFIFAEKGKPPMLINSK